MAASHRDAIFSTLQFLERNNYQETARTLERESGLFFNINHFADLFISGSFDEAEEYVSGFTRVRDNMFSTRVFYAIRWNMFLEALDEREFGDANEMVGKFKDFEEYNPGIVERLVARIELEKQREGDFKLARVPEEARRIAWIHMKKDIEANPKFAGKIQYCLDNPVFGGFLPKLPAGHPAMRPAPTSGPAVQPAGNPAVQSTSGSSGHVLLD